MGSITLFFIVLLIVNASAIDSDDSDALDESSRKSRSMSDASSSASDSTSATTSEDECSSDDETIPVLANDDEEAEREDAVGHFGVMTEANVRRMRALAPGDTLPRDFARFVRIMADRSPVVLHAQYNDNMLVGPMVAITPVPGTNYPPARTPANHSGQRPDDNFGAARMGPWHQQQQQHQQQQEETHDARTNIERIRERRNDELCKEEPEQKYMRFM